MGFDWICGPIGLREYAHVSVSVSLSVSPEMLAVVSCCICEGKCSENMQAVGIGKCYLFRVVTTATA